jgi:hypothetical protein
MMLGRPTEGVALLRQAKEKAGTADPTFKKELLYNLGSVSSGSARRRRASRT